MSGTPSPHPPGAGWPSVLGVCWDTPVPRRYLVSVMETFLLYKHFQKSPPVPSARQELADFWLAFLLASCQPFVPAPRCPVRCASGDPPGVAVPKGGQRGDARPVPQVLVLELGKVLWPARLAVRSATEEHAVTLALVRPSEEVGLGFGVGGLGEGGPDSPLSRSSPSPPCRRRCPAGASRPRPSGG